MKKQIFRKFSLFATEKPVIPKVDYRLKKRKTKIFGRHTFTWLHIGRFFSVAHLKGYLFERTRLDRDKRFFASEF
jgi:hypothetical protein